MSEKREPVFNIPWPVLVLVAVLIAIFAIGRFTGYDPSTTPWGFAPRDLTDGRALTLVTSLFIHGNWPHVLGNCAFAVAFATPVARRCGEDARGSAAFLAFYLVCGLVGNLGYAAFNLGSPNPVLGASGAIAGMMGAASRLIGQGPGELSPFRSRPVIGMAAAWVIGNIIYGVLLVGWAPGSGGIPIAWQVHLAGYAAGLFLFAPLLTLIGRRTVDHGIEN